MLPKNILVSLCLNILYQKCCCLKFSFKIAGAFKSEIGNQLKTKLPNVTVVQVCRITESRGQILCTNKMVTVYASVKSYTSQRAKGWEGEWSTNIPPPFLIHGQAVITLSTLLLKT